MDGTSLFGFGVDALWAKSSRRRRSGTGLSTGTNLPDDIKNLLGEAEAAYLQAEYDIAIEKLSLVTKKAPRLAEPYSILALIYEESGDRKHALQLYALAAAFSKKNPELWKKVLMYSMQMGEYQQSLVALNRCLSLSAEDQSYLQVRIVLTASLGQIRPMQLLIRSYLTKHPDDILILVKVVDLLVEMGYKVMAMKYCKQFLEKCYLADQTFESFPNATLEQREWMVEHIHVICAMVRTYLLLHLESGSLLDALTILERLVVLYHTLLGHGDEAPTFPMELSLLVGYLNVRLASAREDEAGIDKALSILNLAVSNLLQDVDAFVDLLFLPNTYHDEGKEDVDPKEIETVATIVYILTLIARKMLELGMKARCAKINDFLLHVVRTVQHRANIQDGFKGIVYLRVAKYFQFVQAHAEALELANYAIRADPFLGDAIQFYAVEVLDHAVETVHEVLGVTTGYLQLFLQESERVRLGAKQHKALFDNDDELNDEDEDEEEGDDDDVDGDGEDEDMDNGGVDTEELAQDGELDGKKAKKVKKTKKSTTKTARGKRKAKQSSTSSFGTALEDDHEIEDEDDKASDAMGLLMASRGAIARQASLEVDDPVHVTATDDTAGPLSVSDEADDYDRDIDLFMDVQQQETASTSMSSTSMSVLASTASLLLSTQFAGIDDPLFQRSFQLDAIRRQCSGQFTSSADISTQNNTYNGSSAEDDHDNRHRSSSLPFAQTALAKDTGFAGTQQSPLDPHTWNHDLTSSAHVMSAASSALSLAEGSLEHFRPLHARHSLHRHVLRDLLQVLCTHALVLAKRKVLIEQHGDRFSAQPPPHSHTDAGDPPSSSASSSAWSLEDEDTTLAVLGLTLLQCFVRVLTLRPKTRETIKVKAFLQQWTEHASRVRQAASTALWMEVSRFHVPTKRSAHNNQHNVPVNGDPSAQLIDAAEIENRANQEQLQRQETQIALSALVYTLTEFIPLETMIDASFVRELCLAYFPIYEALIPSSSLPMALLQEQRQALQQQMVHLESVQEVLLQRRRSRELASVIDFDDYSHHFLSQQDDGYHALGGRAGGVGGGLGRGGVVMKGAMKRSLFTKEAWLTSAALISEEVGQAAEALWSAPEDVSIANYLFRLLVDECYGTSTPQPQTRAQTQSSRAFDLSRFVTASDLYLENRLPVRILSLEHPQATSSAVASFLAGHDVAVLHKHLEALDHYLNAFKVAPQEPLIALTLAAYLFFLATHPLFKPRYDNLLRGLTFLLHYQKLRRASPWIPTPTTPTSSNDTAMEVDGDHAQSSTSSSEQQREHYLREVALYQETLYNLGRVLQDLKLHHLAAANYRHALHLFDQHLANHDLEQDADMRGPMALTGTISHVTREAAHNLVLLYRQSQSPDLALSVLVQYLRFE